VLKFCDFSALQSFHSPSTTIYSNIYCAALKVNVQLKNHIVSWVFSMYKVSCHSHVHSFKYFLNLFNKILCKLEIDRHLGQADISGWYLGFTDISVSAKMADLISLSRCWQNAVISAHKSWFFKFLKKKKGHRIHYIFDNAADNGIGYRSMNGQYISITTKKAISVNLQCKYWNVRQICVKFLWTVNATILTQGQALVLPICTEK